MPAHIQRKIASSHWLPKKMSILLKNRKRAIFCNGMLLCIALLYAPVLAHEQNRLVHLINAYRESPDACEASVPKVAGPLSPDSKLATIDFSQGGEQALRNMGLHVVAMESISVTGPLTASAAMRAIRNRYCKVLAKPEYTLIGISHTGDTWRVVLARPRLAQDSAKLDGAGKRILYLANAARAKARTCGTKQYGAAPPLSWNTSLADAARAHSTDMAKNNYFAHAAKDGTRAGERARQAHYRWQRIGENIAAGQDTAESAMDGWLSSPGHCANLMNPQFKEMGAAYAINENSDLLIYWTQVFGTQR